MNILMVYPKYPSTFWSFKHILKIASKKAAYPPLGLVTVAAMLPREWKIKLIDMNIDKLRSKDLEWADYIMISAMLTQKESVHDVIDKCRLMGKKTIVGGPLFNSTPDIFLPLVDHLILDEAEHTLPPFLRDLEKGCPQKVYRSSEYPDLSKTPVPRWDLLDPKKYAALLIQCSRGCPFNCEFCDITAMYGHKPRLKRVEQIIQELDTIYKLGWRGSLFFVDDNFIGNKVQIKKMLPKIIEWMKEHDYPFELLTEASINLADDDELIDLMVEAGFDMVFIGLETPSEKSLRECSKNQNCSRDLVGAIKQLQSKGLQVLGGYIVGFDSDDEGIFARQIKFIQESGVGTAMVNLLSALPNTKLWNRLKAEKRLDLDIPAYHSESSLNFIPEMDRETLIKGYKTIVKTIYSPRNFYKRVCNFLDTYEPRRNKKIQAYKVKAFLKSIYYVGILGNGISQWYFWKMFFKSSIYYRKSFSEAMTLMVYGRHFQRVAKRI